MNIIIIGAGEIGRHMAGKLANRSHNLCVIEKDETIIEDLNKILDVRFIQGEGASIEILKEAKASECSDQ
jgi:trk system potassium uptake protein TrkA